MKGVDLMWYDITGSEDGIEYQILDTSNTTHIKVRGERSCYSRKLLRCCSAQRARKVTVCWWGCACLSW